MKIVMTFEQVSLFILLLIIISLDLFYLLRAKKILEPGILLNWYWIISIVFGILVFNRMIDWNVYPLIYIMVAVILFQVSFHSGKRYVIKAKPSKVSLVNNEKLLIMICSVCIAAFVMYFLLMLKNNGFTLSYSLRNMRDTGSYFGRGRYQGEGIKVSLSQQLCATVGYSGFVLMGYSIREVKIVKRLLLLNFIPVIAIMLTTTGKTVFISAILLFACGWLVRYAIKGQGPKIHFDIKKYAKYFVVGALAFYALFLSFVVRYGGTTYTNIYNRILVYAIGQIPCFDNIFMAYPCSLFGETFGYYTFTSLFDLLGIQPMKQIVFNPMIVTPIGNTNVPTIFMDFIFDFGIIGSLLEILLFGFLVGIAFTSIKKSQSALSHGILGLAYYCIFYSFLVNPMRYLSIVGAFILFVIYIKMLSRIRI